MQASADARAYCFSVAWIFWMVLNTRVGRFVGDAQCKAAWALAYSVGRALWCRNVSSGAYGPRSSAWKSSDEGKLERGQPIEIAQSRKLPGSPIRLKGTCVYRPSRLSSLSPLNRDSERRRAKALFKSHGPITITLPLPQQRKGPFPPS